jgi:hypothetical protein
MRRGFYVPGVLRRTARIQPAHEVFPGTDILTSLPLRHILQP